MSGDFWANQKSYDYFTKGFQADGPDRRGFFTINSRNDPDRYAVSSQSQFTTSDSCSKTPCLKIDPAHTKQSSGGHTIINDSLYKWQKDSSGNYLTTSGFPSEKSTNKDRWAAAAAQTGARGAMFGFFAAPPATVPVTWGNLISAQCFEHSSNFGNDGSYCNYANEYTRAGLQCLSYHSMQSSGLVHTTWDVSTYTCAGLTSATACDGCTTCSGDDEFDCVCTGESCWRARANLVGEYGVASPAEMAGQVKVSWNTSESWPTLSNSCSAPGPQYPGKCIAYSPFDSPP